MRLLYGALSQQGSADGNKQMYFAEKENQSFFLEEWEGKKSAGEKRFSDSLDRV